MCRAAPWIVFLSFAGACAPPTSHAEQVRRDAARAHGCPLGRVHVLAEGSPASSETVLLDVCGDRRIYFAPPTRGERRARGEATTTEAPPAPTPTAEVPTMYRHAVRAAIARRLRPVQRCFESELPRHPGLSGRVVVGFTIGVDGVVTEAWTVERTLPEDVADCMVRAVRNTPFPEPETTPVTLHYPFSFEARPRRAD